MKKTALIIVITITAIASVKAQTIGKPSFKPFKVDISSGYAFTGGTGSNGGVLFTIEPKYAIIRNISLGLRLEAAIVVAGTDLNSSNNSYKAQANGSYLATGDYYFYKRHVRPFVGGGIGLFTTAGLKVSNDSVSNKQIGSANKFGGMIRTGLEYKHVRFGVEYNMVGETAVTTTTGNYNIKNSYLSIKLGVLLGGGKKKEDWVNYKEPALEP